MEKVKRYYDQDIQLNHKEESMLMQKSKVTQLKMEDGNNTFFHALVKEREKIEGDLYSNYFGWEKTYHTWENKNRGFYTTLVRNKVTDLRGIDIPAIRSDRLLPREKAQYLILPVEKNEIWNIL